LANWKPELDFEGLDEEEARTALKELRKRVNQGEIAIFVYFDTRCFFSLFSKAKLPGKAIHDPFFDSLKQRPGDFDAHRTFHNQLLNEFFGLLIL